MALFIPAQGILILQVPGAASTSLENALTAGTSAIALQPRHGTARDVMQSRAIDVKDVREIVCIVRNHFDALHAEWFRSRTRWVLEIEDPNSVGSWPAEKRRQIIMACALEYPDYIRWLVGNSFTSNAQLNLYESFSAQCNQVFQLEDMGRFARWLSGVVGKVVDLPIANHTDRRPEYWRDYTRETREIVNSVFRDELTQYGYAF